MAQRSGPISQGTDAERQFDDIIWRDMFGDEPGVIGDLDGSAYALTLASGSDVAAVGSTTQTSTARVAGFGHRIPEDDPESITIPVASGSPRTDIIGLSYDPANTGLPGPVRLARVAGTTNTLPTYDAAPPGVEFMPLWAVTRSPGQALSAATVVDLRVRVAPVLTISPAAPLPLSSPLGTIAWQGNTQYRRVLGNALTPIWDPVSAVSAPVSVNTTPANWTNQTWKVRKDPAGRNVHSGTVKNTNSFNPSVGTHVLGNVPTAYRPTLAAGEVAPFFEIPIAFGSGGSLTVDVRTNGDVIVVRAPSITIPAGTAFSMHSVGYF